MRELADLAASAEVIDVDDARARIGAQGEVIVLGTQSAKLGFLGEPLSLRVVESDEQGLGRNILGDPLAFRLGEQRRQPLSIASCNLGNGVEGGDVHLVERDARRLIWTHEVGARCKDPAGRRGSASRNSDASRQSSSRFRRARRSCRGRTGSVLVGLLLLHSKDLEWGPQGVGTKERVKSGG